MSERAKRKNARHMLSKMGYAKIGGHMRSHSDAKEDAALIKKMVKPSARNGLKDGGCADGGMAKPRADRLARGGKPKHMKGKGHTTVNVVVAGGGHPAPPRPIPVPIPAGPGPGPGAGPVPMPPPGPMAAGPGGPPMPPPGLKRGGHAKAPKIDSQRDTKAGMPAGHFNRGGKTKAKFPVPMETGAGGGRGRLAKAKEYGA